MPDQPPNYRVTPTRLERVACGLGTFQRPHGDTLARESISTKGAQKEPRDPQGTHNGGETLADRLERLSVPEPNTGCRLYLGCLTPSGYGRFRFAGRVQMAHRAAYELRFGPVPDGLEIDHLCRQRSCLEVRHLEAVTHHENWRRGTSFSAENARKTHCKFGHPFADYNLLLTARGFRNCRICMCRSKQKYYRKHRERLLAYAKARAAVSP